MKTNLKLLYTTLLGLPMLAALVPSSANAQSFLGSGFGPIPDGPGAAQTPGPALDISFTVSGLTQNIADLQITMALTHTWVGDIVATLISPGGTSFILFGYTGATTGTSFGTNSDLTGGTYTFSDTAGGNWWTTAAAGSTLAPGAYRTSTIGGPGGNGSQTSINAIFGGLTPAQANGTWHLTFTDGGASDTGSVSAASLNFTVVPEPGTTALLVVAAGALGVGAWRKRKTA